MTRTLWAATIAVAALAVGLYVTLGQPDETSNPSTQPSSQLSIQESPVSGIAPDAGAAAGNLGSVDSLLAGLEQRLAADPSDAKGWLLLAKSYSHLGRTDDAAVAYAKAKELGQVDPEFEATLHGADYAAAISPTIRGRLTVADAARSRLDPQDPIFIFAKSTDGSAMPVAVLRKVAGDLPFDFELSDKQAMSAEAKLSSTLAVTVTARVSKSGDAMQAEPGLEVVSQPVNVGEDVLIELQLGKGIQGD